MRLIDITISSNVDLTALTSRRITVTRIDDNTYNFRSSFKHWDCGGASFIYRLLLRNEKRIGNIAFVIGNCSSPSGYEFIKL